MQQTNKQCNTLTNKLIPMNRQFSPTTVVKKPSKAFMAVCEKLKALKEDRRKELRECKKFDIVVNI